MTEDELEAVRAKERENWTYPMIDKVEIMDHGFAVALLLKERDGSKHAVRVRLEQILGLIKPEVS